MRRFLFIFIVGAMLLSAAACGRGGSDDRNNHENSVGDITGISKPIDSDDSAPNVEEVSWQEGEIVYLDEMSVEDISQYIRGRIFQRGSSAMAAGLGEVIYFSPQGNEYYWFCSSMDAQSRIRAEYGTWELEDGYMTTTTRKFIE